MNPGTTTTSKSVVPVPVVLPNFSVASTKPEAAVVRSQGWLALAKARVVSDAA